MTHGITNIKKTQRFRQYKHTGGIYWKKYHHRYFCNKQRLQRKLAEYNAGVIR
jgi:hypothetical protein